MSFWKKNNAEGIASLEESKGTVSPASQPSPAVSNSITEIESKPPTPKTPDEMIDQRYGAKLRTALGPGTVIQGKLSFDAPVRIDGKLSGEIFATKDLIVGKTGDINADIHTAFLVVLGKVKGKIKASDGIELLNGAVLEADISTPKLIMEEGAVFRGNCQMTK